MKTSEDGENIVICVVNLDPHNTQSGTAAARRWWELGMDKEAGLPGARPARRRRYHWRGERNYVELNPHVLPAHVFASAAHGRAAARLRQRLDAL